MLVLSFFCRFLSFKQPVLSGGFQMSNNEDPRRTQAALRAHQNAKIVDDYSTSIMTALLTLNGLAIGAVLTAVGTEKVFTTSLANYLSAGALACFGLGIFAALRAVLWQRRSVAAWRDIWEARARGEADPNVADAANSAGSKAENRLGLAVCLFLVGALIIAAALFTRESLPAKPAAVGNPPASQ